VKCCRKCKLLKIGTEFYRNRRVCNACMKKYSDEYRRKNYKRYYETVRRWRLKNPKRVLEWRIRRSYDFTEKEIQRILQWSGGFCSGCERPLKTIGRGKDKACIDHNHSTKKFRGFLCNMCNVALGQLGDDIEKVRGLLKYMERECES